MGTHLSCGSLRPRLTRLALRALRTFGAGCTCSTWSAISAFLSLRALRAYLSLRALGSCITLLALLAFGDAEGEMEYLRRVRAFSSYGCRCLRSCVEGFGLRCRRAEASGSAGSASAASASALGYGVGITLDILHVVENPMARRHRRAVPRYLVRIFGYAKQMAQNPVLTHSLSPHWDHVS